MTGDQDQGRMPEVIAWPESDPDYNPTARHDKPDEFPNTNVPAHGRCPPLELYPRSKVLHKPSAAGHPSADGRLSSSTHVIHPRAHRSCVRRPSNVQKKELNPTFSPHRNPSSDLTGAAHLRARCIRTLTREARISALCKHLASRATLPARSAKENVEISSFF